MTSRSMVKLGCALALALGAFAAAAQNVMPVRPPARLLNATQSEGTWPQRFDVGGPESTSFGFAVTRPGPIRLVVQWQGPPLTVQLRGPQSLEQTGQGRIQLDYQVSAADLQKSLLWQISVSLATPAPVAAAGSIELQRPPVDAAVVQSHLQIVEAARAARASAQPRQPSQQTTANFEGALQASLARFNQGQLARRADAERQFNMSLRQPAAGQVTSRGVSTGTVLRSDQRDLAVMKQQLPPSAGELPAKTRPVAPPVATVPAPVISAIAPSAGQPGDQVVITGSGFGASAAAVQGQVRFMLNPGKDVVASIDAWTDTQIVTRVPAASGLLPSQASVSVTAQGATASASGFQFTPVLGTRTWYMNPFPPGANITKPGNMTPVGGWPGGDYYKRPTGAVDHKNWDAFFGHKDNDELLRGVVLQNGWVLEDVIFATYDLYGPPRAAGAYLASVNKGSNAPILNVRWWTDGYVPMFQFETEVLYTMVVIIKGPADLPDGWLCATAPCK